MYFYVIYAYCSRREFNDDESEKDDSRFIDRLFMLKAQNIPKNDAKVVLDVLRLIAAMHEVDLTKDDDESKERFNELLKQLYSLLKKANSSDPLIKVLKYLISKRTLHLFKNTNYELI